MGRREGRLGAKQRSCPPCSNGSSVWLLERPCPAQPVSAHQLAVVCKLLLPPCSTTKPVRRCRNPARQCPGSHPHHAAGVGLAATRQWVPIVDPQFVHFAIANHAEVCLGTAGKAEGGATSELSSQRLHRHDGTLRPCCALLAPHIGGRPAQPCFWSQHRK